MRFIGLLITFTFFHFLHAQRPIDGPFELTKEDRYLPAPEILNSSIQDLVGYQTPDGIYAKTYPIYKRSYLYAEQELARIRVLRYISIHQNRHLSDSVNYINFTYKDSILQAIGSNDENLIPQIMEMGLHFPSYIPTYLREFNGVNVDSLINTQDYTSRHRDRWLEIEPGLPNLEKEGLGYKDERGVFHTPSKIDFPQNLEIISLEKLIIRAAIELGTVTFYEDMQWKMRKTTAEVRAMVQDTSTFRIKGYRIKEDYFVDDQTGNLTSRIIGIGLVGENKEVGKELAWLYYPELIYALRDACTIYQQHMVITYEHLFDLHYFIDEVESIQKLTNNQMANTDAEFMVRLDALLAVKLLQEECIRKRNFCDGTIKTEQQGVVMASNIKMVVGEPDGKIVLFHSNGNKALEGKIKDGKCHGMFKYYYDSGELKATRSFENGVLNGLQQNFWPDNKLYAKYAIKKGEIMELSRYYEDGKLMESGKFENGVVVGEWTYHIQCSERDMKLLNMAIKQLPIAGFDAETGKFAQRVKYTHERLDHCSYPPGFCLSWEPIE